MNRWNEWDRIKQMELDLIKLDMLRSLAKSQRAIASIMSSTAEIVGASKGTADHVTANLDMISKYEQVLTHKLNMVRQWRMGSSGKSSLQTSKNGKPWLNGKVTIK